jgi:hypothetical protein
MKVTALFIAAIVLLDWSLQAVCGDAVYNLIEPGISLGEIHIGQKEDSVKALPGMSKYLMSRDIVVQYSDDGDVTEIMTISHYFKTNHGITTRSSATAFRKLFPSAQLTCTIDRGVSGISTSRIYDNIDSGIAFSTDTLSSHGRKDSVNIITVHRKNTPVSIFGEIIDCAKPIVP